MINNIKESFSKNKAFNGVVKKLKAVIIRIKNLCLNVIFRLLPVKKDKIVFLSYYGESYSDNPKYICDELLKRKTNLDIVWILDEKADAPYEIRKVPYGSVKSLMEMASAKVWVTNLRIFPQPKKKKNQFYLQTWHGSYAVKLIEGQAEENLTPYYVKSAKNDGKISDAIIAGDSAMLECMQNSFWLSDKNEILTIGNPKNDPFYDEEYKKVISSQIRSKYNIADNTVVILFMPTFRLDNTFEYLTLDYERIIEAFEEKYNKEAVILVRLHPNVYNAEFSLPTNKKIINVTDYPEGFELMIAADYMISDFSGVMANFALLKKCVFIFAPDYDRYVERRGLNKTYFDMPVEVARSNEALIDIIRNFDDNKQKELWKEFFDKYVCFDDGHASEKAAEWILSKVK